MRKNNPKPVPHLHPKDVPKAHAGQPLPCWHAMTEVQLSLYDIPNIRTACTRGGKLQ